MAQGWFPLARSAPVIVKRCLLVLVLGYGLGAGAAVDAGYAGRLADAIKKAENSERYPYGIIAKRPLSDPEARRWCLNTIKSNYARWERAGKPGEFIPWLGRTYCPVGADNDPHGLNRNWVSNVSRLMK